MRETTRRQLVDDIAAYIADYDLNAVWASTPSEAAEHIVGELVEPTIAALPGRKAALAAAEAKETNDG